MSGEIICEVSISVDYLATSAKSFLMNDSTYQRLPPTRGALFGCTFDAFCFGTVFVLGGA